MVAQNYWQKIVTKKFGHKYICNLPKCDRQNQSQILFATDLPHFTTEKSVAIRQFSNSEKRKKKRKRKKDHLDLSWGT